MTERRCNWRSEIDQEHRNKFINCEKKKKEEEKREGKGYVIKQRNRLRRRIYVAKKCIVADNDSPEKQQKQTMEDKLHIWMRPDRSEEHSRSAMAGRQTITSREWCILNVKFTEAAAMFSQRKNERRKRQLCRCLVTWNLCPRRDKITNRTRKAYFKKHRCSSTPSCSRCPLEFFEK